MTDLALERTGRKAEAVTQERSGTHECRQMVRIRIEPPDIKNWKSGACLVGRQKKRAEIDFHNYDGKISELFLQT